MQILLMEEQESKSAFLKPVTIIVQEIQNDLLLV